MSINVKSEEAHELAHELARLTGESLTQAVTTAVRERLERVQQTHDRAQSRTAVLQAIGRDTAPRLTDIGRILDHGELLHHEHGLPR